MSKYRYEFGVSTNKVGSEVSEEVDLVDDWGFSEEILDEMSDAEFTKVILDNLMDYEANNIESWATPIDGSRDY